MSGTIVDRLYTEYITLKDYLITSGEISFQNTADEIFRKNLLLTAASYFERRICESLEQWVCDTSGTNQLLVAFVKNRAITRQYHTLFDWDAKNANSFFGCFGGSFRTTMAAKIQSDSSLGEAIKAFIEIGGERNRLVHQDFGSYTLEKTAEEIYTLYNTALIFVNGLHEHLKCI